MNVSENSNSFHVPIFDYFALNIWNAKNELGLIIGNWCHVPWLFDCLVLCLTAFSYFLLNEYWQRKSIKTNFTQSMKSGLFKNEHFTCKIWHELDSHDLWMSGLKASKYLSCLNSDFRQLPSKIRDQLLSKEKYNNCRDSTYTPSHYVVGSYTGITSPIGQSVDRSVSILSAL